MGGRENVRYLLDSKGKVLQTYDTGTDNYMEDGGERTFLVGRNTENGFGNGAIDWEGKTVIPFIYNSVEPFSEGLAAVSDKNGTGFVNRNGEVVIPLQFEEAKPFSDGLAVVKKKDGTYAYIDKNRPKSSLMPRTTGMWSPSRKVWQWYEAVMRVGQALLIKQARRLSPVSIVGQAISETVQPMRQMRKEKTG